MKFSLVLLAGGSGSRFGATIPKQFMSLNGKPVIQYSLDIIEPLVDEVIIVSDIQYKDYKCVPAGESRGKSVLNGVREAKYEYIIIHEAVRPFIRKETIKEIKEFLKTNQVVDTITPLIDGFVDGVPIDKKGKCLGLTPEAFNKSLLLKGFSEATKDYQDEVTMLYDLYGIVPAYVNGVSINSKITFEEDLGYAEGIMRFWTKPIDKTEKPKHTLIFGGSGGIGGACAKQLKCHCPNRDEIDLSGEWSIDLTPYDSIIHSAGEYHNESKIMAVNFNSCVRLVKLAEEQDWRGNIVFLSSASATYGRKGIPIYSASKSALNSYIESRAEELSKKGIYINAIAPAKVDTPLQTAINPDTTKSEMITPDYVADYITRYLNTKAFGHIIYLRKGLDI
jgi:2-C-methyl-D-erythritol 4-phosphate cytidylyltransferase